MKKRKLIDKIIIIMSIIIICFSMITAYRGSLPAMQQRIIHLAFISIICLITYRSKNKMICSIEMVIAALMFSAMVYILYNYKFLILNVGSVRQIDIVFGLIVLITVPIATKKSMGWPIVIISLITLVYCFMGNYLPGKLGHKGFSIYRTVSHLSLGTEGILGIPLGASATYVILFILFATFLKYTGAGDFFINLAFAVVGKSRGGPAKAAIVASALFGTISGSAVANTVGTGTFTIPLMKKIGFESRVAGAVTAVAASGGQIMPPIMGAAAFIMAEMTGISYVNIIKHASIPAILYFLSLFYAVDLYSAKRGITEIASEKTNNVKNELLQKGHLLLPLFVLLGFLLANFTAVKAGFYSIVSLIIISSFKKSTRMKLPLFIEAFESGAKATIEVCCACASAGIIIGALSLTGLGLKFSSLIVEFSMGIPWFALVLTMIASLILGMGLPTVAAYLMLAVLVSPALVKMGFSIIGSHLFIFYFGIISAITPPVALAAYAASGIAGADPMKIGFSAVKFGLAAFIVPYMFIYQNELLLIGSWLNIGWSVFTAVLGVYVLAVSVAGYYDGRNLNIVWRAIMLIVAITLISANLAFNIISIVFLVLVLIYTRIAKKKNILDDKSEVLHKKN